MAEKKRGKQAAKKTKMVSKTDKPVKTTKPTDFPIVGLGASAGGLEALEAFFSPTCLLIAIWLM